MVKNVIIFNDITLIKKIISKRAAYILIVGQ